MRGRTANSPEERGAQRPDSGAECSATAGGAPPQQSRSIERQNQVRSAAVNVLLGSGAAAVTHRRVAEEAGASLGAIRYYFRARADLLAACLEEIERVRCAEAERMLEQAHEDPSDAQRTAWMALHAFYGPDLRDAAITGMVWCIVDCARESPTFSAQIGRHRQAASRQVQQLLSARGYQDLSPTLAPAILDGRVITAATSATTDVAEAAVTELATVLSGTGRA